MNTTKPPTLQLGLLLTLGAFITVGVPQLLACESSRASASAPDAQPERPTATESAAAPRAASADTRVAHDGAVAVAHGEAAPIPVGVAPPRAAAFAARSASAETSSAAVSVRRLVVAHDVVDREPVVREGAFASGQDRVFAFVEARNVEADASGIRIYFEGPAGQRVGDIGLAVPAGQRRWRTWGFSRNVTTPGTWEAVVVDDSGAVLAREAFEVR